MEKDSIALGKTAAVLGTVVPLLNTEVSKTQIGYLEFGSHIHTAGTGSAGPLGTARQTGGHVGHGSQRKAWISH